MRPVEAGGAGGLRMSREEEEEEGEEGMIGGHFSSSPMIGDGVYMIELAALCKSKCRWRVAGTRGRQTLVTLGCGQTSSDDENVDAGLPGTGEDGPTRNGTRQHTQACGLTVDATKRTTNTTITRNCSRTACCMRRACHIARWPYNQKAVFRARETPRVQRAVWFCEGVGPTQRNTLLW